ncbi:MAG: glycosyltransferase family 4 protein [candidate division NC10 bacterium]|nr:glycosyltransferase family 4 protein [candidate division NC10 bacterium]
MRILLYSRVFPPAVGGMERFAEDLAGWLAGHGHAVTVATRTPTPRAADHVRSYRVLRAASLGTLLGAARRADVIHVNGLSVKGIALALSVGRRPVVTHAGHQAICPTGLAWNSDGGCSAGPRPGPCGGCAEQGLSVVAKVRAHRVGTQLAAINVCVSHYLAGRLGLLWNRVIYNPVATRAFAAQAPGPGEEGVIAFAGRLVAEKGLDLLIRALAYLPSARLDVAGNGPLRESLETLAKDLGVSSRVWFLGERTFEGVAELYARAAVVCVPSICHESFGYSAAEAMAMERPVVATPNGALPELLGNSRGFVAERATPEALAVALSGALVDPAARSRVAASAQAFALAELDIGVIGRRYVQCYEDAAR